MAREGRFPCALMWGGGCLCWIHPRLARALYHLLLPVHPHLSFNLFSPVRFKLLSQPTVKLSQRRGPNFLRQSHADIDDDITNELLLFSQNTPPIYNTLLLIYQPTITPPCAHPATSSAAAEPSSLNDKKTSPTKASWALLNAARLHRIAVGIP